MLIKVPPYLQQVLETPFISKVMSRNRFELLWRYLHFSDNTTIDTTEPLGKVKWVLGYLTKRFRRMFTPYDRISIDEGMLSWRGRLQFRVYNPAKPTKYGIKSYILCDSRTGYCHALQPYCGTSSRIEEIVKNLLGDLLDRGYTLYMDNFYNSVELTGELLMRKTHTVGTLRRNRGAPAVINDVEQRDLQEGLLWRGSCRKGCCEERAAGRFVVERESCRKVCCMTVLYVYVYVYACMCVCLSCSILFYKETG